MGNNKSSASEAASRESTVIENLQNASVHFDNIYNFNERHTQKISELHNKIDVLSQVFFFIIVLVILYFVIKFVYKKCTKRHNKAVQEKAQALAIEMLEKGQIKK